MNLLQLYNKLSALDIEKAASESVAETKEAIGDLNAMQMNAGLRADGSEITPSYSDFTVMMKKLKGQPWQFVTLRDTGAFQAGINVQVLGTKITIGSTDPKSAKLENKYSKARGSIFGLSEKYKAEYVRENLRPAFAKKIESLTGLKYK
jgi:hypothetical protein